jgi:hypothetical protein
MKEGITASTTRFEQARPLRLNLNKKWPELPWAHWAETASTLQLWTQIIGKIRLALAPRINHWWHITLYPTCRGLTTSPMPYGDRMVQIDFDFINHQLLFQTDEGITESITLEPMPVADFYAKVMDKMTHIDMPVKIRTLPCEIPDPIPFEQDDTHKAYDPEYATRFWTILLEAERVFTEFRSGFIGKVSPVHFFWGGFDLAVSRFSGQLAPKHASVPNIPDSVVQTAYSHEVISCGFWPGGSVLPEPIFYAYAYPAPEGFSSAPVIPKETYFHQTLGEFVLPYKAVRSAENPDEMLLAFLRSTYEAGASLLEWNRNALEAASKNI